jgi:hypothetical protein
VINLSWPLARKKIALYLRRRAISVAFGFMAHSEVLEFIFHDVFTKSFTFQLISANVPNTKPRA